MKEEIFRFVNSLKLEDVPENGVLPGWRLGLKCHKISLAGQRELERRGPLCLLERLVIEVDIDGGYEAEDIGGSGGDGVVEHLLVLVLQVPGSVHDLQGLPVLFSQQSGNIKLLSAPAVVLHQLAV